MRIPALFAIGCLLLAPVALPAQAPAPNGPILPLHARVRIHSKVDVLVGHEWLTGIVAMTSDGCKWVALDSVSAGPEGIAYDSTGTTGPRLLHNLASADRLQISQLYDSRYGASTGQTRRYHRGDPTTGETWDAVVLEDAVAENRQKCSM